MERYAYTRTTATYHDNYVRNTRAVGVLWAVFTICFAIINILVFLQPYWIGSVQNESPKAGIFGLYQYCMTTSEVEVSITPENCKGSLNNFGSILSTPFKVSTILVGVSALLIILCVACMLLFFFVKSRSVYCLCSVLQLFSFLCMVAGCVVYPFGWNEVKVREVCGFTADIYDIASCQIRWAYILAIIGIFDILFLCILGFILAFKQVKLLPEYQVRGSDNMAFDGRYVHGPIITPMDDGNSVSTKESGRNLRL